MKPALLAGDFFGPLDCRHAQLHMKKVGPLGPFTIYDYHYTLGSACKGCAIHGGQNVVVFRSGRYVGRYKPYEVRLHLRHGALILSPRPSPDPPLPETVVRLTRGRFPDRLLVNGEEIDFIR